MITTAKALDATDKKIITGIKTGLTQKEIACEIGITPSKVAVKIRWMKEWYKCKTMAQLILKAK